MPSLPAKFAKLIDLLCDRYEAGCKAGQIPDIVAIVRAAPAEIREPLFRELLRSERIHQGTALTEENAHAKYAELGEWSAGVIQSLFAPPVGARLEVIKGPHAGMSIALPIPSAVTVGRNADLPVSLPGDRALSRVHWRLEVSPVNSVAIDIGGKGGIALNGKKVDLAAIRNGDRIDAGSSGFTIHIPESEETISVGDGGEVIEIDSEELLPTIPGYRIVREIGRGAMGRVYLATQESTGESLAVKTILPQVAPIRTAIGRFYREIDFLRTLNHPNIVAYRDSGTVGRLIYLAMEYVPGKDAKQIVYNDGPIAPERLTGWAVQLCDGLIHAHAQGIIHRDLKPANLIVHVGAGQEGIKLSDFGLGLAYEASGMSRITQENVGGGTPAFMPPEQVTDFRGVTPAADQYGLAATLYYLLTGQAIYEPSRTTQALLLQILEDEPIPLRSGAAKLPGRFGIVIRRALARHPGDRFRDMKQMKKSLLG